MDIDEQYSGNAEDSVLHDAAAGMGGQEPQRVIIEVAQPKRASLLGRMLWGVLSFIIMILILSVVLGYLAGGVVGTVGPRPVLIEEYVEGTRSAKDKIAIIPLNGIIIDASVFGPGPLEVVSTGLEIAAKDDAVRAVILEVNSPGGGIAASDELHRRINSFRSKGKNVVVLMRDLAASGGYYVSAGADHIVAEPTALTGSIGVILGSYSVSKFLNSHGVSAVVYKSGEMKDILSPMRDVRPEEDALLMEIVGSMFAGFKDVVMEGRAGKVTEEDFQKIADGRILTAKQALDLHLVDEIGYMDDAVKQARSLAGVSGGAVVRYWRKQGLGSLLVKANEAKKVSTPLEQLAEGLSRRYSGSPFMYLWPGP